MLIGGLQKSSLLDYPDKVAAVVFTVGCNFRCGFCHNPTLATRSEDAELISEDAVFKFLGTRRGLLDAVVVTGGEPTLQWDLEDFFSRVKEMGFLTKLDTNGTDPDVIARLISRDIVDMFAMDIKHRLTAEAYERASGAPMDIEAVKRSVELIKGSGIVYEFRTTLVLGLHEETDVLDMAEDIQGAEKYVLQRFVPRDDLNAGAYRDRKTFDDATLERLRDRCLAFVKRCDIR